MSYRDDDQSTSRREWHAIIVLFVSKTYTNATHVNGGI